MHTKDRKPWAGNPAAFKVDQTSHLIPQLSLAQCEKALYVAAYNHGALSFAALVLLFRRHPEWRSA